MRGWLAVLAVVFAGCATAETAPQAVLDEQQGVVAQFLSSPAVERARLVIEERARRECMRARGWAYVDRQPTELLTAPSLLPTFDAKSFAEQFGYGLTIEVPELSPELSETDRYEMSLSASETVAYLTALQGSPNPQPGESQAGSCNAEAASVVAPLTADIGSLLESYVEQVASQTEATPEVIEARQQWRDCMSSGGVDGFDSSGDLRAHFARLSQGTPTAADQNFERLAASVDVSCSVPLEETIRKVRRTAEEQFFERNRELFDRIAGFVTAAEGQPTA